MTGATPRPPDTQSPTDALIRWAAWLGDAWSVTGYPDKHRGVAVHLDDVLLSVAAARDLAACLLAAASWVPTEETT